MHIARQARAPVMELEATARHLQILSTEPLSSCRSVGTLELTWPQAKYPVEKNETFFSLLVRHNDCRGHNQVLQLKRHLQRESIKTQCRRGA
ncbi:hypothetical protein PoB_003883200 [Plakobranchus ocellatus]|uniref:Uncharacterized protein n=1 Tax=Plakobranchus ocellatus TaxID=259542 RepID=A0AAV4AZ68_9GAST|nr:hypothetical protein PoB_003883200 [Plakobranchus ocellatus]